MCYRCRDEWDEDPDATVNGPRLVSPARGLALGLHPRLNLAKACADFYLLERLEADGSRTARRMLRELESKLTREFSRYIDMASGGELRHYPMSGGYDGGGCECGYGCDEDCEILHYCAEQECENQHTCEVGCHVQDEACDEGECECEQECETYEGCGMNGNYEGCPNCNSDHTGCEMQRDRTPTPGLLDDLPIVSEYLQNTNGRGSTRDSAWEVWLEYRREHGLKATGEMVRAFMEGPWGGGFGGEAWGTAARLAYDVMQGAISERVFVNMAWSAEHNGGCIFNKLYNIGDLNYVLQKQAEDDYDVLAKRACSEVAKLWKYRNVVRNGGLERSPEWLGDVIEVVW